MGQKDQETSVSYNEFQETSAAENSDDGDDTQNDPQNIQKNSSLETISALLNQMLGGTMLVLPVLFQKNGMIGGIVTMSISGIISCKTCLIFNTHFKAKKETDYQQSIKRILGKNYEMLYKIAKLAYLFFVLLIFYCLIAQQLYMMITFFFAQFQDGDKYFVPSTQKNQFVFDKFSLPYASILAFLICCILVFQKNIVFIIKIAGYGTISIFAFCVFILYIFFDNIFKKQFSVAMKDQPLFSWDIGTLAGTSAMAFQLHINACQSLRCNKNQKNNKRDMAIVYIVGALVYILIGVLGSLAITGNCSVNGIEVPMKARGTINDCFNPDDVLNLIIILSYLFNLVTSFPIYFNLLKESVFELALKGRKPSTKQTTIFNLGYLTMCIIVQNIPGIQPDQIMGLNGAVCCFFFIYFIPILMHIQCYHGKNKVMTAIKKSLSVAHIIRKDSHHHHLHQDEETSQSLDDNNTYIDNEDNINRPLQQDYDTDNNQAKDIVIQKRKESRKQSAFQSFESCNYHEGKEEGKYQTLRIFLYGFIGLVGVVILFYEIYLVIASF